MATGVFAKIILVEYQYYEVYEVLTSVYTDYSMVCSAADDLR